MMVLDAPTFYAVIVLILVCILDPAMVLGDDGKLRVERTNIGCGQAIAIVVGCPEPNIH